MTTATISSTTFRTTTTFVPAPSTTTVARAALKAALADVLPATTGKTLPVLGHVLLRGEGGLLTVSGTDLTIGVSRVISASVTTSWAMTVPAKLLADVVGALPGEEVILRPTSDTTLNIGSGRAVTNINGFAADEFPHIPAVTGAEATFVGATFADAIRRAAFAAATDDTRPVLTGLLIRLIRSSATLAAADGFRLVRLVVALPEPVTQPIEAIVPAKALATIAPLIAGTEAVHVTVGHSAVSVRADGVQATTRLIDGKYPDIERIIPTSHGTRFTADVAEMKRATKLAGFFAAAGDKSVKLSFADGRLTIAANATEVGDQQADIGGSFEGEPMSIASNVGFLADALAAVTTDKVYLEAQTSRNPLIMRPTTDGSSDVQIIMPMTLK
ncbi:MAG: hypothetical protein RLZZ387_257 [Chloroflexota bacterium]|jgi:DNA polymerase-3 subunit beta